MKIVLSERICYKWLMVISAILGSIYFLTSHIQFLLNALDYGALSIPNIMYGMFRLECIVLPIIFLLKRNRFIPKILIEKVVLAFFAAMCLSGVIWIFGFLNYEAFRELFDFDKLYKYQFFQSNYFVGNRLLWGTASITGVFFSLTFTILLIITSMTIQTHRLVVSFLFTLMFAFRLLAPIICLIATGEAEIIGSWLLNNLFSLLSSAAFLAAIFVAARSDELWVGLIWSELADADEMSSADY